MKEFYIPHKPVVKPSAKTTEPRIVYHASAKPTKARPSLNKWLEVGMCLHDVVSNQLLLTGDLKQAFL